MPSGCVRRELAAAASEREPNEMFVSSVEQLLFEFTYDDGSTVLTRFLGRRHLDAEDQSLVEGFSRGLSGLFEVVEPGIDVFRLRSVLDDLEYVVAATMPGVIGSLKPGSFLRGRILPVADVWILSGLSERFAASARPEIADLAMRVILANPALSLSNPELEESARRHTATLHATFLAQFGSDVAVRPAVVVGETYATLLEATCPEAEHRPWVRKIALGAVESADFDPSLKVALFSHPEAGVSFYVRYDEVAAAFSMSDCVEDPERVELVVGYLDDATIPPWVIERLVADAGPVADTVLGAVLGRPEFRWATDGAALMDERKPSYAQQSILPTTAMMPSLVREFYGSQITNGLSRGPR